MISWTSMSCRMSDSMLMMARLTSRSCVIEVLRRFSISFSFSVPGGGGPLLVGGLGPGPPINPALYLNNQSNSHDSANILQHLLPSDTEWIEKVNLFNRW
jgi:hypothetical protein